MTFVDGDPDVEVLQGAPSTFFIVAEATASGSGATPHTFVITHLTNELVHSVSTAEDRDNDIGLTLEWTSDVSSAAVTLVPLYDDGDLCANSTNCESSFCVDAVCCESSCAGGDTGDCLACSRAAGASADGVCGAVVEHQACGDTTNTLCTAPDTCDDDDSGVCEDNHALATVECRVSAGDCDVAETCDGAGVCPADGFQSAGTTCGDTTRRVQPHG